MFNRNMVQSGDEPKDFEPTAEAPRLATEARSVRQERETLENQPKLARIILTIPAVFLAIVPPLVDLNETHVLNPLWIGHARLHTVWLLATNSLVSLTAIVILWRPILESLRLSVILAGVLVGSVLTGFFVAAATQSSYGGSLTDPNGVAITAGPLDANLATFLFLFLLVVASFLLARRSA